MAFPTTLDLTQPPPPQHARLHLGYFPAANMGNGDRILVNVAPGAQWTIQLVGTGTITRDQLEAALNQVLSPWFRGYPEELARSQGEFRVDLASGTLSGRLTLPWNRETLELLPPSHTPIEGTTPMPDPLTTIRYVDNTVIVNHPFNISINFINEIPGWQFADFHARYTDALRRGREATRAETDGQLADEARRRDAATEKAWETLKRVLNDRQELELAGGYFDVVGSKGNTYRIHTLGSVSGNIFLLGKDKREVTEFCCHSEYGYDLAGGRARLPNPDQFLAQKLLIETDEVEFLRTTVVNEGRRPDVGFEHDETAERRWSDGCCICRECEAGRGTGIFY